MSTAAATTRRQRRRHGFVLPLVVVGIATASLLALALIHEALLGARGARAALVAHDTEYRAEWALSAALASWPQDSLWNVRVGERRQRGPLAGQTMVEWYRHDPLTWLLRARSAGVATRRLDVASRELLRAVWLVPPALPIEGAITTNGTVLGVDGTTISGADRAHPTSPCGAHRDTASLPAIAATGVAAVPSQSWASPPPWRPAPTPIQMRTRSAVQALPAQVGIVHWNATPRALPAAGGWNALVVRGPAVTIAGPTAWHGLLVVDGNTSLSGVVQVTGVLVVLGTLRAAAAQLTVQGALIAADTSAGGVTLGSATTVQYDRCAVQLALAVGARPTLAPFSLWHRLSQE